jgi:hypothetical protein
MSFIGPRKEPLKGEECEGWRIVHPSDEDNQPAPVGGRGRSGPMEADDSHDPHIFPVDEINQHGVSTLWVLWESSFVVHGSHLATGPVPIHQRMQFM